MRVFSVPVSVPFLRTVIAALVDGRLVDGFEARTNPLNLARATLYLPTRRAGRLSREIFLDELKTDAAILPRIIGQSRASELLYTGRFMTAEEGERWGFFGRIVTPEQVLPQAQLLAKQISEGPTFANTMTKRMLAMEWAMSVEEAIEAEAVAQALCMTTEDFARAFEAFSNKRTPAFQGN